MTLRLKAITLTWSWSFVDGLNLSELLARVEGGYLTYAEAAHMVSSLAKALHYAHENGVLHLDIKRLIS